jgi:hypothetical protein
MSLGTAITPTNVIAVLISIRYRPSPQTPLPERERGFEKYLISPGTAIEKYNILKGCKNRKNYDRN